MKKIILITLFLSSTVASIRANNIQVNNVAITGQNTAQQYSFVKFDLSWENSWRISVGPANWDAAWVFIKFRVNSGPWSHAYLNYNDGTNDGHTVPSGVTVRGANDGQPIALGVFIHRSADGSGNVNWQNVQLRWNYGTNGVGNNDLVDVQVFAIEMVYVPQASFYVGSGGGSEIGKFYAAPFSINPYNITSEAAITIGGSAGNLYYASTMVGENPGDRLGPVPAAYPKGFNALYCQKYETSQDQWVSFFNTLTDAQKLNRDITDANHKNSDAEVARNTVAWSGTGSATTTTPNRPVNYVSWSDANAYLDWAALRPMTELEYEKACRGPLPVVPDGYAWGTANIHGDVYTLTADGSPTENISNSGIGTGNALYTTTNGSISGPIRCGTFAASAINKNREETGGSYYGIMEMTGNIYERMVTLGLPSGRAFTGLHGNGILNSSGDGNVAFWVTVGGFRGGCWANGSDILRLADRTSSGYASDIINSRIGAARGVRTAN